MYDRKGFIGGSDIAAVMGLDRRQGHTALRIWCEKTGNILPEDLSDKEYVELGSELEDFIAKKFERKTGLKVRRSPCHYTYKKYDFMRCQVDRLITNTEDLLECKNASEWKTKEWEDENIPIEFVLQVSWQLMITGRKVGWIAVLLGGNKFRYKKIEADQELFGKMRESAIKFWGMVQDRVMPAAVAEDNDLLPQIYPKSGEQIQAVEEMNDCIATLLKTKIDLKELEVIKNSLEVKLKEVIKDNLGIKTSEYTVFWKTQETSRLNIDAIKKDGLYNRYIDKKEIRVLRVNKNKKEEV